MRTGKLDDGFFRLEFRDHLPGRDRIADLDEQFGDVRLRDAFAAAAGRALRAGFDAVELHMAHGYLLHQFLSPLTNRRNDAWGGDFDGRARLPLECARAVRAALPEEVPLAVRVSHTDWVEGGWTTEETVELSRRMKALGVDLVDVSSGGLDPRQRIPVGPGYQVPGAEAVRRGAGVAVAAGPTCSWTYPVEAYPGDGSVRVWPAPPAEPGGCLVASLGVSGRAMVPWYYPILISV